MKKRIATSLMGLSLVALAADAKLRSR